MSPDPTERAKITIITPVFNEEASLPEYERAVSETLLSRQDYAFEILFIDDGSQDASWPILKDIHRRDPRFRAIRLSRNFGVHAALSAGFDLADGDAVAILACDLQDPPAAVLEFLEKWKEGAKIVWGHRRARKDSFLRRVFSRLFNVVIQRHAMPRDSLFTSGSFLLVDRLVVECFRQFRERSRITFALFAWAGFDQAIVHYDREARVAGVTSWNVSRILKASFDTFVGFSSLPINVITSLGVFVMTLCIPLGLYVFVSWLLFDPLPGWTGLMLVITVFFAIQFLILSVLGQYLQRIFVEVAARPLYFVSEGTALEPADESDR